MANLVPFSVVKSDPIYVNGDLDTKRALFKSWYQVNKEEAGDDEALAKDILTAADLLREREDLGATWKETVGDVAISAGAGLGGAGLGFLTPVPGGTIAGGVAGGALGADIVQRREIGRGEKFDYSVARTVAEGAMNAIPGASTVGRGVMPVLKAAGKDALRLGAAGAAGSVAEQVETRGEVDPTKVAFDAATMGVGAGALRTGFEAVAKPLSRRARRKMSDAALNKLEGEIGADELTTDELGRVVGYKGVMATQAEEQAASKAQALMDDEELASFIRMVQEEETPSEPITRVPSEMTKAEILRRSQQRLTMPEILDAQASQVAVGEKIYPGKDGVLYVENATGDLVPLDKVPNQRTLDSAKTLGEIELPGVDNIEATLSVAPEPIPAPATAPSLATQADNALAAGSLDNVNAEANKISGVAPVAKQAPLGEQLLEAESAGLHVVTDPDGSIFVEDGQGNVVDQFTNKEEAQSYIESLSAGEAIPVDDEASAIGKTVLSGTDEVVPSAIEEPEGVIRTGPQRMVIGVEGEGKAEIPGGKGWAKGRAEKRLRAIETELDTLANEALPAGDARRTRMKREQMIAEGNAKRDALAIERLKIQSELGDETATAALARYEEELAAQTKPAGQVIKDYVLNQTIHPKGGEGANFGGEIKDLIGNGLPARLVKQGGKGFDKLREGLNEVLDAEGLPLLETEADTIEAIKQALTGRYQRVEPKRVEMELPAANRGKAVEAESPRTLNLTGNSTLPSAGEPIIGAIAGFGMTQREEGESDEAYQERRMKNALLGMGVMSLGAAGIRRLASKMGIEQAGIQLEKLGVAAQSAAKPAAKKQTREELMAQVVKLNEIIAAQTKGTPYEGMSGPVVAAVQAGPSKGFDPAAKAAEIDAMNAEQRKGAEKTLKEKASDTVRYFQRKLITANEAVYRMADLAERKAGKMLDPVMDPRIITPTRGMNNQTQATGFIKESGLADFVMNTLPAAAKEAGMEPEVFRSQLDKYLISKQALTRYAMGATEEEVGGGISKQVASDFVASLAKVMEPHAKFVNGIYRQLLEQSVSDSLVSRDLADWLVKVYPDYVPFSRIFDSDEVAAGLTSAIRSGKSTASISGQTLVQKFLGSQRGIESPLEEVFGRVYATFEQGGRNATAQSWVNLGSSRWLGDSTGIKQLFRSAQDGSPLRAKGIFEEVNGGGYRMLDANGKGVVDEFGKPVIVDRSYVEKTDQDNWIGTGDVIVDKVAREKAKHKISFLYEGEKLDAEVPKEFEEAAKGLNVPAMGLFAKIMNLPVRVGRAGFTSLNPTFALRQIPRDMAQIVANTKGFRDIPNLIKNYGAGVKSAFASRIPEYAKLTGQPVDSELVKRWEQYAGRFNFTEQFRGNDESRMTVSRLMGNIPMSERPMQTLRRVEDVISAFEDMGRLAVFKTEIDRLAAPAIEQGLVKRSKLGVLEGDEATMDNIFLKAAYESQERSANYLNKGEWGRALNGVFLYLNAGIQGTRANVKAFKQSPAAYALKAMVAGGAALATATAYNLATPERAKAYMDLTEDERNRNLILLHPMGLKDEEGNYIALKLPLPAGVSGLAQSPRRVVEDMYGFSMAEGKPEMFKAALSDLFGFVTPFEPDTNKLMSFATPQAVRPLLEASDTVNRNFFSGQQVVPRYLQKLPPADQYKATTPLVAREIGAALNVSPIKIDYLAKNYTGVVGSTAMWAADQAISAATGKPSRTRSLAKDVANAFSTTRGGEQLNRFYSEYERASAIYEGVKSAMKRGDEERARELIKDNASLLRNYQALNGINQKMTALYSDIRMLEGLVDKRPDLKDDIQLGRQQLTELARIGNQLVSSGQ